jgi:hypothetical protein
MANNVVTTLAAAIGKEGWLIAEVQDGSDTLPCPTARKLPDKGTISLVQPVHAVAMDTS